MVKIFFIFSKDGNVFVGVVNVFFFVDDLFYLCNCICLLFVGNSDLCEDGFFDVVVSGMNENLLVFLLIFLVDIFDF